MALAKSLVIFTALTSNLIDLVRAAEGNTILTGDDFPPLPPKPPTNVRDIVSNNISCVEPPFSCPHARIQFFLYTKHTQKNPELLDTTDNDSLYQSHFNPAHPVKIVIHGFQGGRNLPPNTDIRNGYFHKGDYNVIVVDYGSLVVVPCVDQISWSPSFAGACIAQLAYYLSQHPRGVPPEKLHLLGWSIGAHIAGLTANYIEKGRKLGRITGLDPTIIFYQTNNKTKDLDSTDALFVDVIHTAAGVLGQWGPSGHADYYVNGGTSQPGCGSFSIIEQLSCDHTKVTPYFIESINTKRGFWAAPCPNRFYYNLGWCDSPETQYVEMGERANPKTRGIFYLQTNAKAPYAKGLPVYRSRRKSNNSTSSSISVTTPRSGLANRRSFGTRINSTKT
ncbi:hypothetical protein WDU94_014691 [Cyamophila willieti]